jgi:hypothetical protein
MENRTAHNRLCAVRSGSLNHAKIYEPVAVPVMAQIGKKPDRTGLQNTNYIHLIYATLSHIVLSRTGQYLLSYIEISACKSG